MKFFLSDYIPPILIKKILSVVRQLKRRGGRIESYQDLDLVKVVLFKNLNLRNSAVLTNLDVMSFRTIAAVGMAIANKSKFTVLDFGGGAGHHQLLAKNLFKNVSFDWTIIETEIMCRTAQEVIHDVGLKFVSDLSSLTKSNNFDLIFSNSAIQYTENPLDTLRELLNREFEHFFITRVPLNLGRNQFSYLQESLLSQNGPGPAPKDFHDKVVTYKNNIVSKDSFELILSDALGRWTSVDEGSWDSDRFGDQVRTFSYFGAAKKRNYCL